MRLLACSLLLGVLATPVARALPVTLEDGVSVAEVDPEGPDGLTAWTVNGVTHLRTQSLWIRVGDAGPETPVGSLPLGAQLASDSDGDGQTDTLFLRYEDPQERFDIELRVALQGSAAGPVEAGASADLATQIRVVNRSASVLGLHLFQYTDVDLFGSAADDAASWSGSPSPNTATVTDASGLGEYESVFTPRPGAVEASLYDALLASLSDDAPTALSGALGASGDVTLGAEWHAALAAGASLLVSQDQQIRVAPIPEPASGLLVVVGVVGLALHRARKEEKAR